MDEILQMVCDLSIVGWTWPDLYGLSPDQLKLLHVSRFGTDQDDG